MTPEQPKEVALPPLPPPVTVTDETWGGFFRSHFSVFVLLFMVLFVFFFTLHIIHHGADATMIQWAQGHSQTFVGALVGALTASGANQLVNRSGPSK